MVFRLVTIGNIKPDVTLGFIETALGFKLNQQCGCYSITYTYQKKTLVIKKVDLVSAFNTSKLDEKQQANIFKKMVKSKPIWMEQIDNSFLNNEFKAVYKLLLEERFSRIFALEE